MNQEPTRRFSFDIDGTDLRFTGSTGENPQGWRYAANGIVSAWNDGHRRFRISCDLDRLHSPEFDVATAAVLDSFTHIGAEFEVTPSGDDNLAGNQLLSFLFPLDASDPNPPPRGEYFSRVWRFDADSSSDIADALSSNALEMIAWADGAWDYFVIILYELIDNVLEHSSVGIGFIEVQIHQSGVVLIAVADAGIGIQTSFQSSRDYAPRTDEDALLLAIQQGVTSVDSRGRGNGLSFATRNAAAANGQFELESGTARLTWPNGDREPRTREVTRFRGRDRRLAPASMTVASLNFNALRAIDSIEVLGHEPVVPERERYEEGDAIVILVAEQSRGTATRRAAQQLRNMIETLHNQTHRLQRIRISFAGVPIISMSYADELVGRLAVDLGPANFMRLVSIEDANSTVRRLIDRAIDHRFAR